MAIGGAAQKRKGGEGRGGEAFLLPFLSISIYKIIVLYNGTNYFIIPGVNGPIDLDWGNITTPSLPK
jgi:hypothetical protein